MTTALLTPIDDDASIEAATRRQFLTLLGTTGLLTGCATPTTTGPEAPPTRRVTDDLGTEMDLPVHPQRVATLSGIELRELLAVTDLSTSWITYDEPDAYTYGHEQVPPVDVLIRAGASWLPIVEEARANSGDLMLSLERISELSADLIVVFNLPGSDLSSLEVFTALPAARAGQVVELPPMHFAITWRNYAAWARQLAEQVRALGPLDASLVP